MKFRFHFGVQAAIHVATAVHEGQADPQQVVVIGGVKVEVISADSLRGRSSPSY